MPHIREVRWVIFCDKNGKRSEPVLQQQNGNYGYWEDVPVIKTNKTGWKNDRKKS